MISFSSQLCNVFFCTRILCRFFSVKVYNSEVAHPKLRGAISGLYPLFLALGLLLTFVFGYFLSDWKLIAGLLAIPTIIYLCMACLVRLDIDESI